MTSVLAAYDGNTWVDWSWVGDHRDDILSRLQEHATLGMPSLVAREAYPGRHVQAAGARERSLVRQHIGTPLTAGGWALYAEGAMADAGFLQGLEERVFHLVRALWFAVRVVPLHVLYYLYSGVALAIGTARHVWKTAP